jgi:NAD(P)-dependent dehydrogenase (short-subunit alcohol dehydrogenase family)
MARLNGHAKTLLAELAPLGRIGRPEKTADAAFFLASDQAASRRASNSWSMAARLKSDACSAAIK